MKKVIILLGGLLAVTALVGQNYTIAKWYNDYEAAMVQTYDDMNADHVNICLPQLKARGMGGTMFIDYDQTSHVTLSGGWPGLMDAVDDGMEMANHTQTHASCDALDQAGLEREITEFRDFVNSNITNQDCNTFAYPYGAGNRVSMVTDEIAKNHIAARCAGLPGIGPWGYTQNWIYDFGANESDYYQIPTIAEHFFKPNIQKEVNNLLQYGGLMTTMWHAVTASDHAQYLDNVLAACQGRVWHPNFRDAVMYQKERRVAELYTVNEDYKDWTLELSDTLKNEDFHHPLTIHLDTEGRDVIGVTQNGEALEYSITDGTINFNAVPDGGDIVVEKYTTVGVEYFEEKLITQVFPNPAQDIVTVSVLENSEALIQIADAVGKVVISIPTNQIKNEIDLTNLSKGNYVLTVVSSDKREIQQLVVR